MTDPDRRAHPWPETSRREVYRGRVLAVSERRSRSPRTGLEHDFSVVEVPDWVNVIPITPAGEVVLIRQHRHGIGTVTLEIPGGQIEPEDESPQFAARREMIEETGYDTPTLEPLGWVHPNPAILDNRCHTFLARDAVATHPIRGDGTEETEVVLVARGDLPGLVRTGAITHALVVAALHRYALAVEAGEV